MTSNTSLAFCGCELTADQLGDQELMVWKHVWGHDARNKPPRTKDFNRDDASWPTWVKSGGRGKKSRLACCNKTSVMRV